jgi:hypothetical protein
MLPRTIGAASFALLPSVVAVLSAGACGLSAIVMVTLDESAPVGLRAA